ncbi:Fc.00g020540.m01.CDS01 [Cosmosporella sp. VM-42]
MSSRRRQDLPIDDSWRMVEGEHDSFDTTILPPLSPPSSASGGIPSQPFSQGQLSFESQDSIGDFARHQEDEQVILREPFRPSLSGMSTQQRRGQGTPEMMFRMPRVDVEGSMGSMGSDRTVTGLGIGEDGVRRRAMNGGSPTKQRRTRRRFEDEQHYHQAPRPGGFRSQVANALPPALYNVLSYLLTLVSMTFHYAQRPLAILLAIYLSLGGLIIAQNMLTRSIITSLSPLCRLPGAGLLHLPFCPSSDTIFTNGTAPPVEFDDLMGVQSQFEQVLEKSADGVSLPFEMKRSETTIRDLRSLVRHSELQARDELVLEFDGYIDTARQTASDLQKFNTHVGSAVDAVISINRWTSRYIDTLAPDSEHPDTSLVAEWTAWIFHPFQPTDQIFNERILLDKYIEHTALVSDRIAALILEAQGVLRLLTKAEDHLSLIYDITSRSSATVTSRRDQVFWTLWTLVGGNTARLHNLSQQLHLLKQVDSQRSTAVAQVSALILELEAIQAGLGDLRDKVAEPELLRGKATIPLSVHIETIDRGVERLEDARRRIRAAENDRVRDALAKGGMKDEERLIDGQWL